MSKMMEFVSSIHFLRNIFIWKKWETFDVWLFHIHVNGRKDEYFVDYCFDLQEKEKDKKEEDESIFWFSYASSIT